MVLYLFIYSHIQGYDHDDTTQSCTLKHITKWLIDQRSTRGNAFGCEVHTHVCTYNADRIIDLLNDSIVIKMSILYTYIYIIFHILFIALGLSSIRTVYRAVNHSFISSSVRKQSITPTRGEHFPNTQRIIVLPFNTTNIYQRGMILLWPHVVYTQWWYIKKWPPRATRKSECSLPHCTKEYNICYNMEYIDTFLRVIINLL